MELALTADDIWVWRYQLKSASALNSASNRKSHPGALIRVRNGFGCLHPWPELGDAPLEEQLKSIADKKPGSQARIAIHCAITDGQARIKGESLFTTIPSSHWLYQTGDEIAEVKAQGFTTIKLKVGPQNDPQDLLNLIAKAGLKIRLDANATFSYPDFKTWWQALSDQVHQAIEFVEDPIPWSWHHWQQLNKLGVPLAVDRDVENYRSHCQWNVYKPAINAKIPTRLQRRFAVTSYMDHPIGQMWAASQAASLAASHPALIGECGLLTHRCFEQNEFSEGIVTNGPLLKAPEGIGLGFDDLLEALPWKRLT